MMGGAAEAGAARAAPASDERRAVRGDTRRSYLAPFFEAGLEADARFAGAGALAASASSEPVVKLTRLPAGR